MPEYDSMVVKSLRKIENATRELLKLDQILQEICAEVQSFKDFNFVAIQLKNKEDQTIETVYGTESRSEWFGLAKHTIQGDPELWDIQAHIVMHNPPRIEIIAGQDRRFDQYIFEKFHHEDQVRLFAPIIFAPTGVKLENLHWNVLKQKPPKLPDKVKPSSDARRTVLEVHSGDLVGAHGQQFEVIGTIEAGFYKPKCENTPPNWAEQKIPPSLAEQVAIMAGQRAGDLHCASLENVFRTIAQSARIMIGADAASLHFARVYSGTDTESARYIYEVQEGRRFPSVTSPRSNGLGQQALQRRQVLYIPNKDLGHNEQYLREFHRDAYNEGMRAEAAIPIFFSGESENLYPDGGEDTRRSEKQGLLYVRFQRPHWFTEDEIALLELLAGRATEAIRRASYHTRRRDRERRLDNIHHIARSLAQHPASPALLKEIAGAALNLLAADIVSVYEYDEQEKRFVFRSPTTAGRLIKPHLITALGDERSAPALLVESPKNIYAEDAVSNSILLSASRDSDQYAKSFIVRERVKSTAALVLTGGTSAGPEESQAEITRPADPEQPKREILGLMFVNYRNTHHFTTEDRKLVETLADTAAIAIRNRRVRTGEQITRAIERIEDRLDRFEAVAREAPPQAEIIEEGLRRALAPSPLLSYQGYLTCTIRDSKGEPLVLSDNGVFGTSARELRATVQLLPNRREGGATARLTVNGERESAQEPRGALFEIEVMGDEIVAEPFHERLRAATGCPSEEKLIRLVLQADKSENPLWLRFYVTQAGRYVGVLQIPIKMEREL